MPEQHEPPRPHGDPLEEEVVNSDRGSLDEPNPAQRQTDATGDAVSLGGVEQPTIGTTSDANGISASDEADGAARKKRYDDGAELVSRID
jgi:hypothetical protein